MVSKKKRFGDDEIPIFDDGCIYKRGDYWHFRLWLKAENKYARKSLGTTVPHQHQWHRFDVVI